MGVELKVKNRTLRQWMMALLSICLCLFCLKVSTYAYFVEDEVDLTDISERSTFSLDENGTFTSGVSITSADGTQWFEFSPNETGTYYFYSTHTGSDVDPYGALYMEEGEKAIRLSYNSDHGSDLALEKDDFCIEEELEQGKIYYLCASLYDRKETGNYTVTVSKKSPYTISDEMSKAEKIHIDAQKTVTISISGEKQWFQFKPDGTGTYYFYSNSSTDPYAEIYYDDGDGTLKKYGEYKDISGQILHNVFSRYDFYGKLDLDAEKTYYIRCGLSIWADESTGDFNIIMSKTEFDFGIDSSDIENPEIIKVNETKSVEIEERGIKWFSFTPEKSGEYIFSSESGWTAAIGLYYHNSSNDKYYLNVSTVGDEDLYMTLEKGETYYLAANGRYPSYSGTFKVYLKMSGEEGDIPSPTPTPTPTPTPSNPITTNPGVGTDGQNGSTQEAGIPATDIAVAKKSIALKKNGKIKLSTIVLPLNSTDSVTFTSSKPKVAQVNAKGVVKAKKPGKAKITIRTSSGKTVTVNVTVKKNAVKAKKVSMKKKLTVKSGTVSFLSYKVNPTLSTDKMTWKSSKKSVITVDNNGKMTAKKAGKAVITVKIGSKKASCKVIVK